MIVVCKKYYTRDFDKRIGYYHHQYQFQLNLYIQSTDSFDEILKSHCKFIESVGIEMSGEDKNLPFLYWTPKLP